MGESPAPKIGEGSEREIFAKNDKPGGREKVHHSNKKMESVNLLCCFVLFCFVLFCFCFFVFVFGFVFVFVFFSFILLFLFSFLYLNSRSNKFVTHDQMVDKLFNTNLSLGQNVDFLTKITSVTMVIKISSKTKLFSHA